MRIITGRNSKLRKEEVQTSSLSEDDIFYDNMVWSDLAEAVIKQAVEDYAKETIILRKADKNRKAYYRNHLEAMKDAKEYLEEVLPIVLLSHSKANDFMDRINKALNSSATYTEFKKALES